MVGTCQVPLFSEQLQYFYNGINSFVLPLSEEKETETGWYLYAFKFCRVISKTWHCGLLTWTYPSKRGQQHHKGKDSGHVAQIKSLHDEKHLWQPCSMPSWNNRNNKQRNQATLQSIVSVLTQAVQCFQHCATAAERHAHACEIMAASGNQANNPTLQAHFQKPSSPIHQEQSYSSNQQWSSSLNRQQLRPRNQHHTSSARTSDSSMSFSSFLKL